MAGAPRRNAGEGRTLLSSVTTAIRLLKAFSADDPELGISELSKRLGIAKSTVHRLASTLLADRLLEQNPDTNRYRLGIALFELGSLVRARMDVIAEAKSILTDLRTELEENVRLAVLDQDQVVYVHDFESPHPVRIRSWSGLSRPAVSTAEGIALLADAPEALIEKVLDGAGEQASGVRQRIREARRRGYAIDDLDNDTGTRCVAAPIRGADARVLGAIGIAGPRTRFRKSMFPTLSARALDAAHEVSLRLGFGSQLRRNG